ncbi:DUF192 domain-containing protein [Treponema brennaborense]|uniref:DUF192 domain-containing protein n=1 Tax=Treponema brennaborense (strain DSM 12168 / CIP 105900 / DD5/3) TaxID=906968 RepID=F4LNP7_TREBD|nr:DUF192 domain-containing protein [Treponema brennaborense]AEE16882.1 protein of unknown function DUF192 [Treponema brennaborense DSM 12168]
MKRICAAVCFCCLVFTAACSQVSRLEKKNLTLIRADGSEVPVRAELARTEQERSFGFMERTVIPDGTGMLFIFERDQILSFWMKNTPHPLSIAFIDSNGVICDIFDMTPYSLASRSSSVSVRYALEVPQGWFERVHIGVGDRVALDW